jgi:hypothetical protein
MHPGLDSFFGGIFIGLQSSTQLYVSRSGTSARESALHSWPQCIKKLFSSISREGGHILKDSACEFS